MRKILRALTAALFHIAVLFGAHSLAVHAGDALREVAGLIADEWSIDGADRAVAIVWRAR